MKKQNGITLIAIVITVIVLLILAAVAINLSMGERSIFNIAASARDKERIAKYQEDIELAGMEVASENSGQVTLDNLINKIYEKKIVAEGSITKIGDYAVLKTAEGDTFVITVDKVEYIKGGEVTIPGDTEDYIERREIEIEIENADVWTNNSKKVTLKSNVQGSYTLQYSIDAGKTWKDYDEAIEMYENGTIYVTLRNALGEQGKLAQMKVNKIDRKPPEIIKVETTPTNIIFSATDDTSGIVGYKITQDTEVPKEFDEVESTLSLENKSVSVPNQNTTYYVWVKDEAENVSAYSTATTTTQPVTSITVTPTTANLKKGEKVTLIATINPTNAFNKEITWESSNTEVATVGTPVINKDGTVSVEITGMAAGNITITAKSTNGENGETVIGTCAVNVTVEMTISDTNKDIGEGEPFTLFVSNASNITWSTSNSTIASISSTSGTSITVTGKSKGTATITATAKNEGISKTCTVTVRKFGEAATFGDYVNYPVEIGKGPDESAHKTDWRIFYSDGTYVYLIVSYLLPNTKIPSGVGMTAKSGHTYTAYWDSVPNYVAISAVAKNQYKMSWNKSTTNENIKCISQLLNTSNWTSMVNGTYALDAIGAPTLEMWVESWNATGGIKLYCNNSNSNGYYIGTNSSPTGVHVNGLSTSNRLYFPVISSSATNGCYYILASPRGDTNTDKNLYSVVYYGGIYNAKYNNGKTDYAYQSLRPVVRLKSTVSATKDASGIWRLK